MPFRAHNAFPRAFLLDRIPNVNCFAERKDFGGDLSACRYSRVTRPNDCWRPHPVGCSIEGSRYSPRNASGETMQRSELSSLDGGIQTSGVPMHRQPSAKSSDFGIQQGRVSFTASHSALPSTSGFPSCENKRYNGVGETAVTEAARSARPRRDRIPWIEAFGTIAGLSAFPRPTSSITPADYLENACSGIRAPDK